MFPSFVFSQNKQLHTSDGFSVLTPIVELNNFISYWIGKPYKYGGRTEKGIDCSQLNKRLYADVFKVELQNVCYKQWEETKRVKRDSLKIGDLVFFRSTISPSGWHCGVYIGDELFFHAANRTDGVKISSLNEPRYKKSYRGGGRKL